MMENLADGSLERKGHKSPAERGLVALVILLIILLGAAGAYFLFTYVSKRDAPPTTFYDQQLRVQLEVLRRNPKDPAALTNVGYIYKKMGNGRAAVSYFDHALAKEKFYVPAIYNKGMYYKDIGREAEAVELLELAGKKAVVGNKYIAYYSLGELSYDKKEYDEALKYLNLANKDNETIWNARFLRAKVYEKRKNMTAALADYEAAAAFNPSNVALQKKVKELKNGQP